MRIHHENLVGGYLDELGRMGLARPEDWEPQFQDLFGLLSRFATIGPGTRILEIGCGSGWFQILCRQRGFDCRGIEISPHLVEHARTVGRRLGLEPDVVLGNVEETDLGEACYDVIFATSVFEHVEHWRGALGRVYRALRPGGLFYFYSTNKFSPVSGEYRFPLYGWLPDRWRYRLRIRCQGPDVMKLGIDFNQFTHAQLRRAFRALGFSRVLDRFDFLDPDRLGIPRWWKVAMLRFIKRFPAVKEAALLFATGTQFVCIK